MFTIHILLKQVVYSHLNVKNMLLLMSHLEVVNVSSNVFIFVNVL